MKITCQTCHAKYTVADEKVVGRIAKIKCKKCSSTIVVNGNDPSLLAAGGMPDAPAGGAAHEEDDGATRVFAESPSNAMSGAEAEWTVNLSESDQPTLSTSALAQALASGAIPMDTYVWRDSLPDWTAAGDLPELQAAMRAMAGASGSAPAAPAYAAPSAPSYANEPDQGLGATMMMPEGSRPAAPAPAQEHALAGTMMMAESPHRAENTAMAARKDKSRGAVDLFGAREGDAPKPPVVNYGGSHTGERNENSVLFSLSALTATENAAKAPKPRSEAGFIDFTPAKSPAKSGGRAAMDDLMNMSGGGFGAAVLAPPPLLAPVVEAPPPSMPPPSLAPVAAAPGMPQGSMGAPMLYIPPAAPQKKSPLPLILGAVAAVAVLGAVAFFVVGGGDKPTTPGATATEQAATTATPPTAETAAAPVTPPPTDTAVAAVDPGEKEKADAVDPTKPPPEKEPKGGSAGATSTKTDTKPKEPAAAATPPPAETAKPTETPPPASGNEFSRSAATSALGAAAGSARSCKKPDGPTGGGKVKVTFAPSGNVTSAQVQGAPFAGTSVGGCVAGVFRGARVPPFDGSPVTVTKSFTIN
jgi:predicted Zn finger-like uncharacterized protein